MTFPPALSCGLARYTKNLAATCILSAALTPWAWAESAAFTQAKNLYSQGAYAQALPLLTQAYQELALNKSIQADELLSIGVYLADTQAALNQPAEAVASLQATMASLQPAKLAPPQTALLYGRLGNLMLQAGESQQGIDYLKKALALTPAQTPAQNSARLSLLNDYAVGLSQTQNKTEALRSLQEAAALSQSPAVDPQQRAASLYNLAQATIDNNLITQVPSALTNAKQGLQSTPASRDKASQLIALGKLYDRAREEFALSADYRLEAFNLFRQAATLSNANQWPDLIAYAYGESGLLYENERRTAEALAFAQRAIPHAQKAEDAQSLYQWYWLAARSHWQLGRLTDATAMYNRAVATADPIRSQLLQQGGDFYKTLGPLYYQYADLALRNAKNLNDPAAKKDLLFNVRGVLEQFKRGELESYFKTACVTGLEANQAAAMSSNAAVIYPVLLEDRIELLVSIGNEIQQFSTPIKRSEVTQTVRDFRLQVERDTGSNRYLKLGQQLHQWLITPAQEFINRNTINTLVIIPDGPLRTMPFAALHNGQQFLIERYALATNPGISLTQNANKLAGYEIFAGGISDAVAGFSPLPAVAGELNNLKQGLGAKVFQNNAFTKGLLTQQLEEGNFNIAHFATHGEFNGEYTKSFILTHDGKFSLPMLEKSIGVRTLQGKKLDLLVLSACQTASGDDKAALGLAGIAIQAGASSALASLWSINDAATGQLIEHFYAALGKNKVNKAESLRRAQLNLINEKSTNHPSNWAPFLLIGNWG